MPRLFAITAASNSVFLDDQRRGEARFTVSNQSGRAIEGRARLVAEEAEAESWVALQGEAHRMFSTAGTEPYTVEIEVPPDAPSGSYTVRLDMVGEKRPDEQYVEGPAVTFEVPEPEPEPEPFPTWIVLGTAGAFLLGVIVIFWCQLFGCDQPVTGTVTDAATGEPLPNANVVVAADTTIRTETADDGTYSLDVNSPEDTLVFSFAGYQEKRVEVGEREAINVELLEEAGRIIAWGNPSQTSDIPSGRGFVAVAAGLALRVDGTIEAWGSDRHGQVSDTPSGDDFVAVAVGSRHSLALRDNGTIEAWGEDDDGQVSGAPSGSGFVDVAAGARHSLALRDNGTIEAWGLDGQDQVSDTPSGDDFVAVAADMHHGLALRDNGTIEAWGWDARDQVSDTPSGSGFVAVAAGSDHNLALRDNGTIEAWGWDIDGQVSDTPSGSGFVAVAAGARHSLALRNNGTIEAWGLDNMGQVSDSPSGSGFVAVAAGSFHGLALHEDDALSR